MKIFYLVFIFNWGEVFLVGIPENAKIVNGRQAHLGNFPYQVALLDKSRRLFCSGSIICNRLVITAGHCLHYSKAHLVRAGIVKWKNDECNEYKVLNSIIHEEFNNITNQNDIGIILIDGEFYEGERQKRYSWQIINRVLIAQMNYIIEGKKLLVAGWGFQKTNGEVQDALFYAEISIFKSTNCTALYDSGEKSEIKKGMFCAVGNRQSLVTDSCTGDSGGGAIINRKRPQLQILIGIVSGGKNCAQPDYPGIYTDVYYFKDWIDGKINKFNNDTIGLTFRLTFFKFTLIQLFSMYVF